MSEPDYKKLTELENLLRRVAPLQRPALLKSLLELFLENAGRLGPAQVNLFDRLFNVLIPEVDKESTAALARRLAPLATAPFLTLHRLAHDDDIRVAEPVLMQADCIEDSALADIARTKGQTHLLAIACRKRLAEPVVDLLVTRGDDVVARYVANNREARLSPQSAAQLVARARYDSLLARLLRQRADVPARLLADLPMPAQAAAG